MLGVTAIKPKERHGLEAIQYFFFDKDTGAVMGRTPKSWALITLFYLVYYTLLAAFWAGCMYIFMLTIDDKVPRWTEDASLIGRGQSLGVRPNQSDAFIDSGLIMFNTAAKESSDDHHIAGWGEWSARMEGFLSAYRASKGVDCAGGATAPGDGKFCKFPLELLGPCGEGNFGYDKGKPCVILKLNKIYGLEPEYYNDPAAFPENFPPRLADLVGKMAPGDRNQVWLDCIGENPADNEAIGDIKYFPASSGFSSQYFPYLNQDDYLPPLAAIQFQNPEPGQLLHIECRAWAANIKYDRRDKLGKAHFELLVHNKATTEIVDKELEDL